MAFQEVSFPQGISEGSKGGPVWNTEFFRSASGDDLRISRWSFPKARYNASFGIRDMNDLNTVRDFFYSMRGGVSGFRFKDFSDFSTAQGDRTIALGGFADPSNIDQVIGTGDGFETSFQFVKNYQEGAELVMRQIEKPVNGTVTIAVDAVNQTVGFTIDYTTGVVTFTVAPLAGVTITWGGEFDVPVRFGAETDEFLEISYDAFSAGSTSVILVEDRAPLEKPERYYYGGSKFHTAITTSAAASLSEGRVQYVLSTSSGAFLQVPPAAEMPDGGEIFVIYNADATNALGIRIRDASSDFASVATTSAKTLYIAKDASGVNQYLAV